MRRLNLSDLPKGTPIYYHGDMANDPGNGIILKSRETHFGSFVTLKFTDGRQFEVPVGTFSSEYKGNGLTRLVTRAAYLEWKNESSAALQLRIDELKEKGLR